MPDQTRNYHYTWLKFALDSFVENPNVVHCIKGDMTIHEFIQKYSAEGESALLKMYNEYEQNQEGE